MKKSKLHLPLLLGILILFSCIALPSIQTTINSNEHDHDDHLQSSYMPCECGKPGCTGNVFTCPWSLGVPRPAPILSQPPSPDGDGEITLYWTSSYGVTSYKVYISDAESGPYTLIATTTSLHYTDTTTTGTWWYYVRAYNNNGYRPSNKVSVEVYLPPEPTILIGSTQRFFPHDETSRLGFTFYSVFANSIPMIELSINETEPYTGDVTIKIKIDMTVAWSTNIDMDFTEVFQSQFNQLSIEGTHQIVVELSNGAGPNNIYRLEYLKIHELHLRESCLYESERYTPVQTYKYGAGYDGAFVSVNNKVYFNNDELKIIGDYHPFFGSSIVVYINPDDDGSTIGLIHDFYIHRMQFQWRVLDPNGSYLPWQSLEFPCDIRPNYEGTDPTNEIMSIIYELQFLYLNLLPEYISVPLDVALIFLTPENTDEEETSHYNIGDNAYCGRWKRVDSLYNGYPIPMTWENSMLIGWGPELEPDLYGQYQVELTWCIEIWDVVGAFNWYNHKWYYYPDFEFSISDVYYFNFVYAES